MFVPLCGCVPSTLGLLSAMVGCLHLCVTSGHCFMFVALCLLLFESCYKSAEIAIPVQWCTYIQVCPVERTTATANTWYATCKSQGLAFDPHVLSASSPMVLYEVPREQLTISSDAFQIQAQFLMYFLRYLLVMFPV